MQQYKKILGKVMMTAEDVWNIDKTYDPISLVTDEETNKSYISRKDVPAGIQINNREYWQPVASSGIIDNGVIILNRKNKDGQIPIYDLQSAAESIAIGDRRAGVILGFLGFNAETDTVPSWKLYQYNDVSPSNWTNIQYWLPMDYTNKYAGWYDDAQSLYAAYPFPKVGMYAYVGNSASTAVVYRCYEDRVWSPTEDKAFTGVVNLADEEDITSKQNKLKFKDKEYNPAQFSGLGKLYLRKNMVDGKNILTQKMIEVANTIYIIQYDYDLQGETITIPEGCMLDFQGGSFSNGSIIGSHTAIKAGMDRIFGLNIEFNGKWNIVEVYSEWFGAIINDASFDSTECLQAAINFANNTNVKKTKLLNGTYYITNPINIYSYNTLEGEKDNGTWLESSQIMQMSEKNAIQCIGECASIYIKNLIIRKTNEHFHTGNGILFDGNGEKSIDRISLIGVQILYFEFGICFKNENFKGISYNYINKCEVQYNVIGIYIEGNHITDKAADGAWVNYNTIENSYISQNKCGGILYNNAYQLFSNNISKCCIEGNGLNYDMTNYAIYGCFGIKISNPKAGSRGSNNVLNCYLEANIPRRTGSVSEKEYVYGSYIYPNNYYNSYNCGSIIIQQNDISIKNCSIQNYDRFVILRDNSYATIDNCCFSYSPKHYDSINKRSVITYNTPYVRSRAIVNNNIYSFTKDLDVVVLYDFISHTNDSNSAALLKSSIISNDAQFSSGLALVDGIIDNGLIYLGKTSDRSGNYEPWGLTKNSPLPSFRSLYGITDKFKYTKELNFCIIDDIDSGWSDSDAIILKDINYPKISIFSETSKSISCGVGFGGLMLFGDMYFRNIVFDHDTNNSAQIMFELRQNTNVVFENCIFNIDKDTYIFRGTDDTTLNAKFINCKFILKEGSYVHFIFGNRNFNKNIEFVNCDCPYDSDISIILKAFGSSSVRPAPKEKDFTGIRYFDTTLSKPIWWAGTSWVDSTGATV